MVMMGILLVLGCIIDWIGICLLTMPIFVPVVKEPRLRPDLVRRAVLHEHAGLVSEPAVRPAAFYLKSVAPPGHRRCSTIFQGVLPFIVLQLIGLGLVLFFPQIAMFLPTLAQ